MRAREAWTGAPAAETMLSMRRLSAVGPVLAWVTLAGCGEDGADLCADDRVVQLTSESLYLDTFVRPAGDGDLLVLRDSEGEERLHLVRPCARSVEPVASKGSYSSPRWLDDVELDGAPLVCDGAKRFVRVDLSGATDPQPVLSDMFCAQAAVTPYGALLWRGPSDPHPSFLSTGIDPDSASVWLLPEFPRLTGLRQVTPPGLANPFGASWVAEFDAFLYFAEDGLHMRDVAGGQDRTFPGAPIDFVKGSAWVLTRTSKDELLLVDRARDVVVPIGTYTAIDERPDDTSHSLPQWSDAWRLNETGTHVLHVPFAGPSEAFDLQGERTTLPLTRRPFDLTLDGGALALTDVAGQMELAYPGDLAPRLVSYPPGLEIGHGELEMQEDGFEMLGEDGNLWFVALDGSPVRLLARGVADGFVRIGDRYLLTVFERELTTIHLPSGTRTVHARDVGSFAADGEGGYYFNVSAGEDSRQPWLDGLWYLPKDVVIPAGACHDVAGCDD